MAGSGPLGFGLIFVMEAYERDLPVGMGCFISALGVRFERRSINAETWGDGGT